MNVFIQLADYAQRGPADKVNSIGLGWTRTSTPLEAHSVVIFVEADDQPPKTRCEITARLVDQRGEPVIDRSGQALDVRAALESGDPQGKPSVAGIAPIILNLAPGMPLEPGVYRWEVTCDRAPGQVWSRSFEVQRSA